MNKQPKFHLSANLWAKLPKLIQEMFVAMRTHIKELEAHVQELEVRLGQSSQNSSRPPSADPPSFQRPERPSSPTRRKRGAQIGHLGRHRIQFTPDEVDEVVELHPSRCDHCGIALKGPVEEEREWRHQANTISY